MFREFDFAPFPDRVADKLVYALSQRFSNPALKKLDIARIVAGAYAVRVTSRKNFDAFYFSLVREAAIKSGKLPEAEFYDLLTTVPKDGYGEFLSVDEIRKKVDELKNSGQNVGLKFGHYRRMTLYQIFELVYARHGCDHLVLIIESGMRTKLFKQKRIELTDGERIEMFNRSCLVNTLGMTNGLDYSDAYYRNLVTIIKPTTLLISDSWPKEVQEEYKIRAKLAGASPLVIPSLQVGLNTTALEPYIFPNNNSGL